MKPAFRLTIMALALLMASLSEASTYSCKLSVRDWHGSNKLTGSSDGAAYEACGTDEPVRLVDDQNTQSGRFLFWNCHQGVMLEISEPNYYYYETNSPDLKPLPGTYAQLSVIPDGHQKDWQNVAPQKSSSVSFVNETPNQFILSLDLSESGLTQEKSVRYDVTCTKNQ